MTEHQCIDCKKDPPATVRKVVDVSGPKRCVTHLRAFNTRQRKQSRARQVERTYDISAEDNHALFLLQGGKCWLCQKATGATKSLAVDHDHATGEVRGRLCGPCNQFIGRLGDDPAAAKRLVAYLTGDTPYRRLKARQVLAQHAPDRGVMFGGPEDITVHQIRAIGEELFADWSLPDDITGYRWLVRERPVGVWSNERE